MTPLIIVITRYHEYLQLYYLGAYTHEKKFPKVENSRQHCFSNNLTQSLIGFFFYFWQLFYLKFFSTSNKVFCFTYNYCDFGFGTFTFIFLGSVQVLKEQLCSNKACMVRLDRLTVLPDVNVFFAQLVLMLKFLGSFSTRNIVLT